MLDQLIHAMRPFDWRAIHPEVLARRPGLPDSDSREIPVQWVEQIAGFSRDDRARHRKHGSAPGVRLFYDAAPRRQLMSTPL